MAGAATAEPILGVRNLTVQFSTPRGVVTAVRDISFDLYQGETLGIVGESGSGKSATLMAILGLLPGAGRVVSGEILCNGVDLLSLPEIELARVRGRELAAVYQDPTSSLNPVMTVGKQLAEAIKIHKPELTGSEVHQLCLDLLRLVGVPDAGARLREYPHQFSGGMRQRTVIAMALANDPSILLADEPTTALDVTIQAQVLDAFDRAKDAVGAAAILVTHDFRVIAERADRVIVMYAGEVAESAPVAAILSRPSHPYTHGLLGTLPRLDRKVGFLPQIPGQPPSPGNLPPGCTYTPRCAHPSRGERCTTERPFLRRVREGQEAACHFADQPMPPPQASGDLDDKATPEVGVGGGSAVESPSEPSTTAPHPDSTGMGTSPRSPDEILVVEGLKVHYPIRSGLLKRQTGTVRAVDGVDFVIRRGETLGLVGESGCGKSTTGRAITRLVDADAGSIVFQGSDIRRAKGRSLRRYRRRIQMLFQDPYSSLDPRMRVGSLVGEPLRIHGVSAAERKRRVQGLLEQVGLDPAHARRYPHEFSGGQRQRIAIARAIATEPDVLVLDEPVSALDISVQAQIVNLLIKLQREHGMALLFIAHDLAVVRQIADDVAVMYLGKIVEQGDEATIYEEPTHPYTQSLLSAIPKFGPDERVGGLELIHLQGDLPSPANPPSGCNFRTRCFKVQERCATDEPGLDAGAAHGHPSACHFAEPMRTRPTGDERDREGRTSRRDLLGRGAASGH